MLSRMKFPLLHLLEVLLWLPMIGSFVAVTSFISADPISMLDLHGKVLPAHWEAAVYNHGRYLQGFVLSRHPVAFGLSAALLIGTAVLNFLVRKAQMAQMAGSAPSSVRHHRIAQATVFGAVGALFYVLVMHVLVGVAPA